MVQPVLPELQAMLARQDRWEVSALLAAQAQLALRVDRVSMVTKEQPDVLVNKEHQD